MGELEPRLLLSAATKVVFGTAPGNGFAGVALSPAVTVDVEDTNSQIVTTDASKVTVEIATGPNGGHVVGKFTTDAVNGVATFDHLIFTKVGNYTVKVVDGALTPATSASFAIAAAPHADHLLFLQQPMGVTAGETMATPIKVEVIDQYGNVLTSDHSTVTLSVKSGPHTPGRLTAHVVDGVATFSSGKATLFKAGAYTLAANDGRLAQIVSNSFNVTAAAADQLAFAQIPTNRSPHTGTFTVTVDVLDRFGNIVTTDTSNVTLALKVSPKGTPALNTTSAAVSGVASFTGLTLPNKGLYILTATDGQLKGAFSHPFTLT